MRLNVDRTKYEKKTTINLVTSTRKKEPRKGENVVADVKRGGIYSSKQLKKPISTVVNPEIK